MVQLKAYLEQLAALPAEEQIEPNLEKRNVGQDDDRMREEQDLKSGAVLTAMLEPGEKGSGSPSVGDLVAVHWSVRDADGNLLASTRSEDGGNGNAYMFVVGEGGNRVPRAWELAVQAMERGERQLLQVKPSFAFKHPDCKMAPPEGTPIDESLKFDLQLLNWRSGENIGVCGPDRGFLRARLVQKDGWETPQAPYEVRFNAVLRTVSSDGKPMKGKEIERVEGGAEGFDLRMGAPGTPPGLEAALSEMVPGEKSLFVMAADQWASPGGGARAWAKVPEKALQVELELDLVTMVKVRELASDGAVTKRLVKEGRGEFPVDCPLQDSLVRVHLRVRHVDANGRKEDEWAYDSRAGGAEPLEFDTGLGGAIDAVELAVRLMLPGEVALVDTDAAHAYDSAACAMDPPPGVRRDAALQLELELVSFEMAGHLQTMDAKTRLKFLGQLKAQGNALLSAGRRKLARVKYEKAVRVIDTTRDWDDEEGWDAANTLKVHCLSNLALLEHQEENFALAVSFCDKALKLDEDNPKVRFRKGKALSMKGDHEEAAAEFTAVKELDPSLEADCTREQEANKARWKLANKKQKAEFKNFFSR